MASCIWGNTIQFMTMPIFQHPLCTVSGIDGVNFLVTLILILLPVYMFSSSQNEFQVTI